MPLLFRLGLLILLSIRDVSVNTATDYSFIESCSIKCSIGIISDSNFLIDQALRNIDVPNMNAKDYSGDIEEAARYIHSKWGDERNFIFYLDAMLHSSNEIKELPRSYLLLKGEEIVGCYALIVNDFISRHDLMPWFASLFVEEQERGKRLSQKMVEHAVEEARNAGFATLYLTTDH